MKQRFTNCQQRETAFTLIELILVMALLTVVIAMAAPSLASFFRGRALENEARRFVTLTRYGQNRAVSEGTPMVLWVDLDDRAYGLRERSGFRSAEFTNLARQDVYFRLAEKVEMEIDRYPLSPRTGDVRGSAALLRLPSIQFLPDGSIDESSLTNIVLREGTERLWIVRWRNSYEVRNETNLWKQAYR